MSKIFSDKEQAILSQVIRHRRDVRGNNFLGDEISDEVLHTILQAGVFAPSVGFSQPWEFVVIRDQSIKAAIHANFEQHNAQAKDQFDGHRGQLYQQLKLEGILEAPVNIAVFYRPANAPVLGQTSMPEMGEYSVVCAIQNMWLMARVMNIGIGWVSIINPEFVKAQLNAPADHKLIGYLCVGHVKAFYDEPELERLNWAKQKALDSAIVYDAYPAK